MIEPLVKEPILSEEISDIIYKSRKRKDTTHLVKADDIYRFKYHVRNLLLNNEDILRTLHHPSLSFDEPLNGDAFIGEAVFDFLKLPENKSEVKNYICYETEIVLGYERNYEVTITIRLVVHDSDMKTDWNINRLDLLSLIVRHTLNWQDVFGEEAILFSDQAYMTQQNYYYRDLSFRVHLPNDYFVRGNRTYG